MEQFLEKGKTVFALFLKYDWKYLTYSWEEHEYNFWEYSSTTGKYLINWIVREKLETENWIYVSSQANHLRGETKEAKFADVKKICQPSQKIVFRYERVIIF